jgi:hypothetical protein
LDRPPKDKSTQGEFTTGGFNIKTLDVLISGNLGLDQGFLDIPKSFDFPNERASISEATTFWFGANPDPAQRRLWEDSGGSLGAE